MEITVEYISPTSVEKGKQFALCKVILCITNYGYHVLSIQSLLLTISLIKLVG